MPLSPLRQAFETACRWLLSQQDRDPWSPSYGYFDRRHWAWKLVDFADATFQRNTFPLAWLAMRGARTLPRETLMEAAVAGLVGAARLQRSDGSFDQAFPHEHSYGATAFVLESLQRTYDLVGDACSSSQQTVVEAMLRRAARFLCASRETHGFIANHRAGAVLALLDAGSRFSDADFTRHGQTELAEVLDQQSREGWFPEYQGADPGYQTLALHYLAQVYARWPDPHLGEALDRALGFLAWFVHPDGTFGGEYGSRRTMLYYPGGIAMLASEFPLAHAITQAMLTSASEGRTPGIADVDFGNLAPLLSSYAVALDTPFRTASGQGLPCETGLAADFPAAGIFVRSSPSYYAIVGASNGGVVVVYDRASRRPLLLDGGYVGQLGPRAILTTQVTRLDRPALVEERSVQVQATFCRIERRLPGPISFLILRMLGLTVMRSAVAASWVKMALARLLIMRSRALPLTLTRKVVFDPDAVTVFDTLAAAPGFVIPDIEAGRPFVSIHMASAGYFKPSVQDSPQWRISGRELTNQHLVERQTVVPALPARP